MSTIRLRTLCAFLAALMFSEAASTQQPNIEILEGGGRIKQDEALRPTLANLIPYATGPDLIVSSLSGAANWGSNVVGDELMAAFSVGTTACNIGDANVVWVYNSSQHPIIRQNLYRLHDRRFEQLGTSWVSHEFFAVNGDDCTSNCPPDATAAPKLLPGCSSFESAGLNGDRTYIGPSSDVNAFTGEFVWPPTIYPQTVSGDSVGYRLQARQADLDAAMNAGARYVFEAHYITPDDALAGNDENNASHRAALVRTLGQYGCIHPYCLFIDSTKSTQATRPAIYAWQDEDPTVRIVAQRVPGEGLFLLGARAEDLGDGYWSYEYALFNLNSHRAAASFRVPILDGAAVRNVGFHDVDYHSGELWDSGDWPGSVERDGITWATTPFADNSAANALRWSSLYNFRFEADTPPTESSVEVGLFRPGTPESITINIIGPALGPRDSDPVQRPQPVKRRSSRQRK